MLRLGNIIRLTSKDIDALQYVTSFTPVDVKRIEDFDAYVEQCKRHYWGVTEETRYLHQLIDMVVATCRR